MGSVRHIPYSRASPLPQIGTGQVQLGMHIACSAGSTVSGFFTDPHQPDPSLASKLPRSVVSIRIEKKPILRCQAFHFPLLAGLEGELETIVQAMLAALPELHLQWPHTIASPKFRQGNITRRILFANGVPLLE